MPSALDRNSIEAGSPDLDRIKEAFSKSSRFSAILAAASAILVLAALIWSYERIRRTEVEVAQKRDEIRALDAKRVGLSKEIERLELQKQASFALLNGVVSKNASAASALDQTVKADPTIAQSIPRIYIHRNHSSDQALAGTIENVLRRQGFVVPAPDNDVSNTEPEKLVIKYFHEDATAKNDVDQIMQILRESRVSAELWRQFYGPSSNPPRTYAIYLPRN